MSKTTTWAVLTDGRYIRVLLNHSPNPTLLTLKADDSQDLAELCYQVVTGVPVGSNNGTQSRSKSNMCLLAEFLDKQLHNELYQQLIIVAPKSSLSELQQDLSQPVSQTIIATIKDDYLAMSIDDIEQNLASYLSKAA